MAHGQDTRFPLDHYVTAIRRRLAHDGDTPSPTHLYLLPHPLRSRASFTPPSAREDEPNGPVTRRGKLIWPSPDAPPVVEDIGSLGLTQALQYLLAILLGERVE